MQKVSNETDGLSSYAIYFVKIKTQTQKRCITSVLLLSIHCLLLLPLFVFFCVCVWSLFCNAVCGVLSSFAIAEEERAGCFTLCSCCPEAVCVL